MRFCWTAIDVARDSSPTIFCIDSGVHCSTTVSTVDYQANLLSSLAQENLSSALKRLANEAEIPFGGGVAFQKCVYNNVATYL